tara:strand:- start:420 stop:593 length:174 start_codon:yes stop_codon:yes gene_type:complete
MVRHKNGAIFWVVLIGAFWLQIGIVAVIFKIYCAPVWGEEEMVIVDNFCNAMILKCL